MTDQALTVETFAVWATDQLSQADLYYGHGAEDAEDEAFWLASYVANFDYEDFDYGWQQPLTVAQRELGEKILKQRITSKQPLAYIINQIWFAGQRFFIDQRALVPRSHLGEWVPELFEPWVDSSKVNNILDLCCGGGSIGIASALYFQGVNVDLADLSTSALEVAQINVDHYGLADRVTTIHSDLFANVNQRYDLILCNPPYVSFANMEKLPIEYRYEPEMALVAGEKGLDSIAIILNDAPNYLNQNGVMIVEAGTAAPALDAALEPMPLNWMMSASGESVVLIISREEIVNNLPAINALL